MIKGTDLAYGNLAVDYAAAKADGIRFGCAKLVQYGYNIDPCFYTHRAGFESQRIPWGPYPFCDYRQSGARNAQWFVDAANNVGNVGSLPWWIDIEYEDILGWGHPAPALMLRFAHDVFDELDRLLPGNNAMLYTNQEMVKFWPSGDSIAQRRLVIASTVMDPLLGPWAQVKQNVMIRQYALDVSVPWSKPTISPIKSSGVVDLDEFLGTEEEFAQFIGKATPEPGPQPAPIPVPAPPSGIYMKAVRFVNIRAAATSSSADLGDVQAGETVGPIVGIAGGKSGAWAHLVDGRYVCVADQYGTVYLVE